MHCGKLIWVLPNNCHYIVELTIKSDCPGDITQTWFTFKVHTKIFNFVDHCNSRSSQINITEVIISKSKAGNSTFSRIEFIELNYRLVEPYIAIILTGHGFFGYNAPNLNWFWQNSEYRWGMTVGYHTKNWGKSPQRFHQKAKKCFFFRAGIRMQPSLLIT